MRYRYPFTPYPKGWYRIDTTLPHVFAFGRILTISNNQLHENKFPYREFPLIKKNNQHYIFFSETGNAPDIEVPDVAEFRDSRWQKPFTLDWKSTRVHIQEIAENALDLSHFCKVHTYKNVPKLSRFVISNQRFNIIMHTTRVLFGCLKGAVDMDITYHGLGIVVANVISKTTFGDITLKVLLETTPMNEEHVDIKMQIAIKKTGNYLKDFFLRHTMPSGIKAEFTRDIPVWEAKIYHDKPILCHTEGNIIRIRKWATQFYETSF
jgi:3-ketosteroid 9alpha-monooxygenase subunit A